MIPGLENAEFVKYGVMHRNTYINSTKLLDETYNLKSNKNIYFAGQITGVEGYMESAASGILAGYNAARRLFGEETAAPKTTLAESDDETGLTLCPECGKNSFDPETGVCVNCGFN